MLLFCLLVARARKRWPQQQPVIEFSHICIQSFEFDKGKTPQRKRVSLCAKTISILKGIYVTILSPDDVSFQSNQNHFFFCEFSFSSRVCLSVLWVCLCMATELPQCSVCVLLCSQKKPKSLSLCGKWHEGERERERGRESFSTPKDKTGDYLRKRRAVEAWKRAIQFRPFGTCFMVCTNYRFFAFYYVFVEVLVLFLMFLGMTLFELWVCVIRLFENFGFWNWEWRWGVVLFADFFGSLKKKMIFFLCGDRWSGSWGAWNLYLGNLWLIWVFLCVSIFWNFGLNLGASFMAKDAVVRLFDILGRGFVVQSNFTCRFCVDGSDKPCFQVWFSLFSLFLFVFLFT